LSWYSPKPTAKPIHDGLSKRHSAIFVQLRTETGKMSIVIVPLLRLDDQTYDDFCEIPGANPIVVSKETRAQHADVPIPLRRDPDFSIVK
jgi:hypothetical protein